MEGPGGPQEKNGRCTHEGSFCEGSKQIPKVFTPISGFVVASLCENTNDEKDLLFDFSKNIITEDTLALLMNLVNESNLKQWIERIFNGEKINNTEGRAVLHIALRNRSNRPIYVDGKNVMEDVNSVLGKMRKWTESIRNGEWKGYTGKTITFICL
jgi:glucose-6-phosphate isomerase